MRPDDLRELLRRRPFRAFRLVLTNGLTHEIRHPELVQVSRSLVQIALPVAEEQPERLVGVALLHVVQYELMSPTAPAA